MFILSLFTVGVFAMNAGMYNKDNSPLGLFIQDEKTRFGYETPNYLYLQTIKNNGQKVAFIS